MSAVGKWFVMMYSQSGEHVLPLVDDNGDPMLWETEGSAIEIRCRLQRTW